MPANRDAAAVTAGYRRRLIRLRDRATRQAALTWRGIDLDADDLEAAFAAWVDDTAATVRTAQTEASRLSGVYLAAYLGASGVTPRWDGPDPEAHAGRDAGGGRLAEGLRAAPAALLWRLGRGDGRTTAMASGVARLTRTTRTGVMGAARDTLREGMVAEPSVIGYRRVTSTRPCGACLAEAGEMVGEPGRALAFHGSCRCTQEAVLRGVTERARRPSGQQMFDRMTREEQAALFAGRGGEAKAAAVRTSGVSALTHRDDRGRLIEAPLAALTGR